MSPPIAAKLLGFAGLAPFFALAAGTALASGALAADARAGLLIYGAAILSFMGGCRWGFAAAGLGAGPAWAPLALSTAPALLAWIALWAEPRIGAATAAWALIVGFLALYLWDRRATARGGAPAWWTTLRGPLTLGAIAALAIAAAEVRL